MGSANILKKLEGVAFAESLTDTDQTKLHRTANKVKIGDVALKNFAVMA